jgi:hypothetical protein
MGYVPMQSRVTINSQHARLRFMNSTEVITRESQSPRLLSGSTPTERQAFWVDTCREISGMKIVSQQVIELYRLHGCRFCAPTQQQAQYVIEALDAALPQWEQVHPELFYQTLELNFPELVRHS